MNRIENALANRSKPQLIEALPKIGCQEGFKQIADFYTKEVDLIQEGLKLTRKINVGAYTIIVKTYYNDAFEEQEQFYTIYVILDEPSLDGEELFISFDYKKGKEIKISGSSVTYNSTIERIDTILKESAMKALN